MNSRSRIIVRSLVTGVVAGLVLAAVFSAGFFLRDALGSPSRVAAAEGDGYQLLDEVQQLLDAHFVRAQPDYAQREYGAIRGMLTTLNDPYTFFIDPPVAASESDVLAGTYGGIGVQIVRSEAGELVLFPFDESPALASGIEDGDILLAVNGTPVDISVQADVLDQMLRGEVREGNGVELTVRKADGQEQAVFVAFAVINVPSVVWRVLADDPRIGYLQVMRFTGRTPDEVRAAVEGLRAEGVEALVLDMRNNAGGLLQESITVADEFIDSGVIVYQRNAQGENAFPASSGGVAIDLPLIVLVNHGTASGAELVAGALQDSGRANIIGQRTYGKGTVQQIFPLSDGSSLHVTSSEWFTPAHQALEQAGLAPNTEMQPDAEGRDVELGEAIRQLNEVLASESA
ncbi:MAG: carboxy-terminal-processing protease [Chloroflexi bacterium OLB15]|nr:MAG: carboxy-terminal-processing protease [Chloroflexi bacterium OLB15]